jgi:hypothetical protein
MEHALTSARRSISNEFVAFVGLGHIGVATLYLFLESGNRPRAIMLVDVEAKRKVVEGIRTDIMQRYMALVVHTSFSTSDGVQPEVYEHATLIGGSVSVANVLDADRLRPGCICVDDSFPPIVDVDVVRRRAATRGDVLFAVAGALEGRACAIEDTITIDARHRMDVSSTAPLFAREFVERNVRMQSVTPRSLTGCILSSMLNGRFGLGLEIGPTRPEFVVRRYRALRRMQYHGTRFYVFDARSPSGVLEFDDDYVRRFAVQFGDPSPSL